MKCILTGNEVDFPCSSACHLFGDCVVKAGEQTNVAHKKPLFYCDPCKNTDCNRRTCFYNNQPPFGGKCMATSNAAFAFTDASGNPVPLDRNSEGTICYVHGRIGVFKGYFQHSHPHEAVLIGDVGGMVCFPVAVVEYPDDGTVEQVDLHAIRFKHNPSDGGGV